MYHKKENESLDVATLTIPQNIFHLHDIGY